MLTAEHVGRSMARLMPHLIKGLHLEFFMKSGVTHTQFLVMVAIHSYENCRMGDLARNMHVRMPTATGLVDRLVRAGFARRGMLPEDRRQVTVSLTAKGRSLIHNFQAAAQNRWREALSGLSPRELAAFQAGLDKIQAQVGGNTP